MDAVEEMLKKQEDFEKMLAGQEDKFHMLIRETKVITLHTGRHWMAMHKIVEDTPKLTDLFDILCMTKEPEIRLILNFLLVL